MSPIEYIRAALSISFAAKGSDAYKIQERYADDYISLYRKHHYDSLNTLVNDANRQILKYKYLDMPTTSSAHAKKLGICVGAARRRLKLLDHVVCDSSKRPFIFSVRYK